MCIPEVKHESVAGEDCFAVSRQLEWRILLVIREQRQVQPPQGPTPYHVPHLDPASAALDGELRVQLDAALQALPENLRSVFVLREISGFSTEETAAMLGLGISAVKVRLHRARLRLRELLAGYLATEREQL